MTQQQPHFQRSFGLYKSIALVAGNMIGSGVLMLPASLAKIGTISLIGWVITSLGALVLALIFSRLSQLVPKSGGPYAYVRATFGEFVGFQIAYAYWIAVWVGNAAIIVTFMGYLSLFFPGLLAHSWEKMVMGISAIWLFTATNIWGMKESGAIQVIVTALKLIPLGVLTAIGLFHIDTANWQAFNVSGFSNYHALEMAITLTLWSFIGLESATVPAEHVIHPKKTIPRATVIGTLIAAAVYILGTGVLMGVTPLSDLANSTAPYAATAGQMFGPWGQHIVGGIVVLILLGSLNGWVLLQGQIPYAAAEDQLFPQSFLKCTKSGSPYVGLMTSSVLVSLLLLLRMSHNLIDTFTFIIELATVMTLLPYMFSTLAEVIYYLQHPENRPQRGLVYRIILGFVGFAYTYWAIFSAGKNIVYYLALFLLLGLPFYVWLKWEHRQT